MQLHVQTALMDIILKEILANRVITIVLNVLVQEIVLNVREDITNWVVTVFNADLVVLHVIQIQIVVVVLMDILNLETCVKNVDQNVILANL